MRSRVLTNCSAGVMPSAEITFASSNSSLSPDTRIMKNSSRFEEKIERNLRRSSNGLRSSSASSRTRAWNASRLSSRLKKNCGWAGTASISADCASFGNSCTRVSRFVTVGIVFLGSLCSVRWQAVFHRQVRGLERAKSCSFRVLAILLRNRFELLCTESGRG